MNQLVLGSNSPRRQQLLRELGFDFEVRSADIDEVIPAIIPLKNAAEYLAVKKNKAIGVRSGEVLLTADTVVIHKNQSLAKPANAQEAKEMLEKLSGTSHQVITGVCLATDDRMCSFSNTTTVHFRRLSVEDISLYISRFKPFDKAGAYGIQEWIGLCAVTHMEGSFHNVVGLPTEPVYNHLVNYFGIKPFAS